MFERDASQAGRATLDVVRGGGAGNGPISPPQQPVFRQELERLSQVEAELCQAALRLEESLNRMAMDHQEPNKELARTQTERGRLPALHELAERREGLANLTQRIHVALNRFEKLA